MKTTKNDIVKFIVATIIVVPILYFLCQAVYIYLLFRPPNTQAIAEEIKVEEIINIKPKVVTNPVLYAYAYSKCEYHIIPSIKGRVNVMKESKVPAFIYDKNTFIILHKGKNWSKGVLFGQVNKDDEKLKKFSFKSLKNRLTLWTFDDEK